MSYREAAERFASFGIDTEKAISVLKNIPISVNCWQGDDVRGFENGGQDLSGGIQTTGNYPGRARNSDELMSDISFAFSLIGGTKRLNLHASYLITDRKCDRDSIDVCDFVAWADFAADLGIALDFNPTLFSHPMVKNNLTLSSPEKDVRDFWVEHCRRSRKIASYFSSRQGSPSAVNLWAPDGYKDYPADRLAPRLRLKESLDRIYSEKLDGIIDSVESKTFGIGLEAFTVGSNEFYSYYAATHEDVYQLLDSGHYHPTEVISEKLSALLAFKKYLPLHVSRPMRWDSDHVVILDDELIAIAKEIVCNDALERVKIGLDYFDASINRIAAWVVGVRNMQKALLLALLEPSSRFKPMQESYDFTSLFAESEAVKTLEWSSVWNEFLRREGMPDDFEVLGAIRRYEHEVLSGRNA